MTDIFAAVDLSGTLTAITAIAVAGIGITLAFKAWALSKRGINRA